MKFTDMNFDCLETVLEYLELIDLLNVADSTKRLNKAAELVFARKHGNKTVRAVAIQISRDRQFEIKDEEIEINDLKTVLQLLRCFGSVISKIHFTDLFKPNAQDLSEIDKNVLIYINKYCADYLKELLINCNKSDMLNYFDRPFPKLITFNSKFIKFNGNVCLNRLFPKMRCLCVLNKHISSFFITNTKHFPYLEQLFIMEYYSSEPFVRNEMVINFLQLNPKLKTVAIRSLSENSILNTDLIRNSVDSLQNVEYLAIILGPITFFDDSDNIIRMKSVKSFEINFNVPDHWSYLPFSFENLESFRIYFPMPQFVNGSFIDQFYNFIDRHSSITNLMIWNIESFGVVDWSRLAKSLPFLLEIVIFGFCFSADEAIGIIEKFQMLKTFCFKLSDIYDNFRKRLGKNWEGTYKTGRNFLELNRKM